MTLDSDNTTHGGSGDHKIASEPLFVLPTGHTTGRKTGDAKSTGAPSPMADSEAAKLLAAALELISSLDQHDQFASAASTTAASIANWLSCPRVVLAWQPRPDSPLQICGDTATADSTTLLAAADEISARGSLTDSGSTDPSQRHSLMAVKQFAKAAACKRVLGVALQDRDQRGGALLLCYDRAISESQAATTLRCLDAVRVPLAGKLAAIDRNQPGRFRQWMLAWSDAKYHEKHKWLIAGIVLVGTLLCFPVTYHVAADCRLQPVLRRYVATPIDGPLEKVYVRPGDEVQSGDLLAKINSREINYQLAAKEADRERLAAKLKGQRARQEFAESTLTELELQSVQLEIDLLLHQRSHLEIRSPLSGMVVSGDLERSEGIPLRKGDTLMEIAPLTQMVVEISVPESELTHVESGMLARFQLYALPGQSLDATIGTVHPAAELIDNENVFVAEAVVEDSDGLLRPGMKGRVWVRSDKKTIAWIAFHRAYHAVRRSVGW
ncbi:efflux RND transporter periplasmic adaptor subunit [Stieleria varia]|uniref:Macrolide transporter subunit MacA n=1 Tax=Stieleria varia TaxID=2528005 RepID=A0A5C6B9E6_9BACT|nr:efflux RND transporter periplasmic adaptor subunit [Stieleria varia]TWU08262.1 macrolide transporter subunit MacA [Stieleria varia]